VKSLRFHREADADYARAAQHYAEISPELGQRFYRAIEELLTEIRTAPTLFRTILDPARRHFRKPFPYAVVYIDKPEYVWVIAVSPFKREPGHWHKRLQ
jgi:putative heme iron utilization protein